MYLKINESTDFELNIIRKNRNEKSWDDRWCDVSLRIENDYFKYNKYNVELLLEAEIEELIIAMHKLLKEKSHDYYCTDFMEPGLEIELEPFNDIADCYAKIKIDLIFDNRESDDYILYLNKNEIYEILKYLNTVIPTVQLNNEEYDEKENKEEVCIVLVKYDDYYGDKTYSYILEEDIEDTQIGDKVIVDRAGEEVKATIVEKGFYNEGNAPYPIKLTKKVSKVLKNPEEYKRYDKGKNKKI